MDVSSPRGYVPDVDESPVALVQLADWRRRLTELYRDVRHDPDPARGWERWRAVRDEDEMVGSHPQSPLGPDARDAFTGLHYHPYDPEWRTAAEVQGLDPVTVDIGTSDGGTARFRSFGRAALEFRGEQCTLQLFWLEAYGGGVYLSFRDATSGGTTYGGGRYLLDTVKGADLGLDGDRLVLDFNFAYQSSCSYGPSWSCPLPPPDNRLPLCVEAGERLRP